MEKIDGFTIFATKGMISLTKGRNNLMYEVLKDNYVKSIGGIIKGIELEHHAIKEGKAVAQSFKAANGSTIIQDAATMDFIYDAHTALFKAGYLTYRIK